MALGSAPPQLQQVDVHITQEVFPARHAMHGTPHPVVQRVFAFALPLGKVEVDQTDYGHPGRFNPCHARQIPTPLQPRTAQIVAAAEALAVLLD
ncbi:MAG TPA: hypothetical protein VII06_31195 [Chloroflexota bacterium]|jgi:hypothetical protein